MNLSIRPTRPHDAQHLPAIEQSAGELFLTIPELAWIADGDNITSERHLEFIAGGACWVAEINSRSVVAFLAAQRAGAALHIWELSVLLDHQRVGIGRALIQQAVDFARVQGLNAVTLSTFRDVPWNEPMYRRFGFKTLDLADCDERLRNVLENEIAGGLPGARRCAMRLHLAQAGAL